MRRSSLMSVFTRYLVVKLRKGMGVVATLLVDEQQRILLATIELGELYEDTISSSSNVSTSLFN